MKVSYPVDRFEKTMCPSGIIFSFWRLTRQTTVSANPPVSADPRIVGTDILKWVSSCLNIVPCIFRHHPYFKNFENRVSQVSEHMWKILINLIGKNRPAFSAIYLFILLTVVSCLSLCGCFPDSWPEKSIGHCIIFYHAWLSCSLKFVTKKITCLRKLRLSQ